MNSSIARVLKAYFESRSNVNTLLGNRKFILKFHGNSFSLEIYDGTKKELDISNLMLNEDSINVAIKLASRVLE